MSIDDFKEDIDTAFTNFCPTSTENAVRVYNYTLRSIADKHAPSKRKSVTLHPQCPWYTSDLAKEKQRRRTLEEEYKNSNLVVDRERYNRQRNVYNNKITAAKEAYYEKKIAEANDSS